MKNDNLFLKFVSSYSDEELLKSIDNPSDFEKDVYNAIISESLHRNLISKVQFDEFFISMDRIKRGKFEAEDEIQLNAEEYWKCPKCGQTVEMNFEICWNCQSYKPEKIVHPTTAKILDYQSDGRQTSLIKSGFVLIGLGIFVLILSYSMTLPEFWGFHYLPLGKFLAGIVFVIFGVFFILFEIYRRITK
jgi:hypothetical protein